MSKKPDAASALAGILKARREPETQVEPETPEPQPVAPEPAVHLPPAPPPATRRRGKSSDPEFMQCSVYLPKKLRRQANRALDDEDKGRDFSGLVRDLVEQWLASRT